MANADTREDLVDMQTMVSSAGRPDWVVPGQPDMWALVLFEALLFTGYFSVYMFCRVQNPELFLQSQAHLNPVWGVVNTLVLLTSSWSIARCAQATREADYTTALRNVYLTIFLGLCFVGLKIGEWASEIQRGLTFTTNEFFSFYYFLTAMHFIHLIVGFFALGVIVFQLLSPARRSREIVETGSTYWHLVDFLWVVIFALLYLMR